MKVTRHEGPQAATKPPTAAENVKNTAETAKETDARGRVIEVSRLNALQYYRLTKAMGANASNSATMEFASIVCAVRSINGEAVDFPATERQLEFLIQQLDFDGMTAAGAALAKLAEGDGGLDAAKN